MHLVRKCLEGAGGGVLIIMYGCSRTRVRGRAGENAIARPSLQATVLNVYVVARLNGKCRTHYSQNEEL